MKSIQLSFFALPSKYMINFNNIALLGVKKMQRRLNFTQNPLTHLELPTQSHPDLNNDLYITGLSTPQLPSFQPYPSLKEVFAGGRVTVIGHGSNANLRAFNYLLLTHLRAQHLRQCLIAMKEQQLREDQQLGRRDRRVSFNNKGTLFLNGPQYENYTLHKLRIFAFSSLTDLTLIKGHPLTWQGESLTTPVMKKLLSEFLRVILPESLEPNYRQTLYSVRHYLQTYPSAEVLLLVLLRYILYSKYGVEEALNYEVELNDNTVCTTLCDAFAVDGLICKDDVFEISTWCRICAVEVGRRGERGRREYFVELKGNQFEEIGLGNDRRKEERLKGRNNRNSKIRIQVEALQQEGRQYLMECTDQSYIIDNTAAFASFGVEDNEVQSPISPGLTKILSGISGAVKEEKSDSSVMSADQDSQMPSDNNQQEEKEQLLEEKKEAEKIMYHSFRKSSEPAVAIPQSQPASTRHHEPHTPTFPVTLELNSPNYTKQASPTSQLSFPSSPRGKLPTIKITKFG